MTFCGRRTVRESKVEARMASRETKLPTLSSVVFTSVEGEISSEFPEARARKIKFHLFTNFSLSTSSMPGSVLGAGDEA